jgi:hypothetical protein
MANNDSLRKNEFNLLNSIDDNINTNLLKLNNDVVLPDFILNNNQCYCDSFSVNNCLKEKGKFYESNTDSGNVKFPKPENGDTGRSLFIK